MSIKINNQDIVAINKGNQVITEVYKGSDLLWQLNTDPLDKSIYFADPEVGRVLHANGLIANIYKSSKRELATITTLNPDGRYYTGYFSGNKVITKFPELQYCTGLTDLRYAFYDCSNLTEVGNIPNSVTDMRSTFSECINLINAPTIPDSVTDMSDTFYECSSLDGIFVIKPVTPPTYSATFSNANVRIIYVPDESVNSYKNASGWSSHRFKIYPISDMEDDIIFADPEVGRVLSINGLIANSIKSSIEELATITSLNPTGGGSTSYFNRNTVITKFPELQYCTGLTSLYGAFRNCSNLIEAPIIPDNVTDMGYTFYECSNLTEAPIIPEGVTNMYGTFYYCSNLTEVGIIPNSVTNMYGTFGYCSSLIEVGTISEGVTDMNMTFYKCSSLISAPSIPEGVTNMTSTFYECTNLIEAPSIPSSVTDMTWTFGYCTKLDGIFVIKPINPPTYTATFRDANVIAIYVPDESVNTYKTARYWRDHSIYPMSQLPE